MSSMTMGRAVIAATFAVAFTLAGCGGAADPAGDEQSATDNSEEALRRKAKTPPAPTPPAHPAAKVRKGTHGIRGYADGIFVDANGGHFLAGWACNRHANRSVGVHVYAGGPAGKGTFVTAAIANQASEPAVAHACRAKGGAYRFTIALDPFLAQFAGQKLYVHGLSSFGLANKLLTKSGRYRMPAAPPPANPVVEPTADPTAADLTVDPIADNTDSGDPGTPDVPEEGDTTDDEWTDA